MNRRETARTIEKLVSGLIAVFIVVRMVRLALSDLGYGRAAVCVGFLATMCAYAIWRPEHADADTGQSTGFARYSQSPGCVCRVAAWSALLAVAGYLLLFARRDAA